MNIKKIFRRFCILLILCAIPFISQAGDLKIMVFSVGSADCTLIIFPTGKIMMIDTAKAAGCVATVIPFLQNHGITHLDYLILTHNHPDHNGGLAYLEDGGWVDEATVRWNENTYNYGDTFTIEETDWFISNASDTNIGANRNSLSYRIEWNGFIYSGAADEGTTSMTRMVNDHGTSQDNLIKAHVRMTAHHGWGPNDTTFLTQTDADLYIVSGPSFVSGGLGTIQSAANSLGATVALTANTGSVFIDVTSGSDWRFEYYDKSATIPSFYTR